MSAFVLVHGAFCAPSVWNGVRDRLRELGHDVIVPTLTMGDARAGLSQHVREVERALPEKATLVGHSYGGMVIRVVADRAPDRVERLVYVDAFVPESGESMFDCRPELERALRDRAVWGLIPPPDPWFLGVETDEQARYLGDTGRSLPVAAAEEQVSVGAPTVPAVYVFCTRSGFAKTAARARAAGWPVHELDTAHMVPLTRPRELADLIAG